MLNINYIFFENFLSFYGKNEYYFANKGMHWITGINNDSEKRYARNDGLIHSVGSGKSGFTFVIQYAFFGEIEKSVTKDKIINKEAKKNLTVHCEFQCENEKYRIRRYRKHEDFGDKIFLEILINDEWKDITSSKPQEQINELIVINQTTFLKSILYSREDESQFFSSPNGERIKIFENIIQLNKFAKYVKRLKDKLKTKTDQLNTLEKKEAILQGSIKVHKKNIEEETTEYENKKKTLTKKIKNLKTLNISKEDFKKIKQYNKIKEEQKIAIKEKKEITAQMQSFKNEIESLQIKIKTAEKSIISNQKTIEDTQNKIENLDVSTCWNCGEIQNKEEQDKIINNFQSLITSNEELITKNKEIIESNKKLITENTEKLNNINIKDILNTLEQISEKLSEIDIKSEYTNLDDDELDGLKDSQNEIERYTEELNQLSTNTIEKHKKALKLDIEELSIIKRDIVVIKEEVEMIEWWIESLDAKNENSIKHFIISNVIPVFNNFLQANLDYIFDGNVMIMVDPFLKETIMKDGEEYTYNEFSTGEKLQLNLSANLAIFDLTRVNLSGCNLVFFDEILNNVDEPIIFKFLKLFEERYAKVSATYLISHLNTIKENITPKTSTIITKENNRSTIQIERGVN